MMANRSVAVCCAAAMLLSLSVQAQVLDAHVEVSTGPSTWAYTLYNDEPLSSLNYLGYFSLLVGAPVAVTGTPDGWTVETDNASYVTWYSTYPDTPVFNEIGPGSFLAGFTLESPGAVSQPSEVFLGSWDYATNQPGPFLTTLAPAPTTPHAAVPEPGSASLLSTALCGLCLIARRRRQPH